MIFFWWGTRLDRHPFDDLESVPFEADDLLGVVRHEPHLSRTDIDEDLCADAVVLLLCLIVSSLSRCRLKDFIVPILCPRASESACFYLTPADFAKKESP